MSTVLAPTEIDVGNGVVPTNAVWRLSADQYHAMIDRGILQRGAPIELRDGLLVLKNVPITTIWRFSLEQYHAMIDGGILHSGDPVEFLEGVLVPKMTKNSPHTSAVRKLARLLSALVGVSFDVHTQDPIATTDSEPEPDISVVDHDDADYSQGHPTANQTAVVVEVSDSSLFIDRDFKKRIYARAGIAEYWIVNLVDRQIEIYSEPTGQAAPPDYLQYLVFTPGQSVPVKLGGIDVGMVAVSAVLP